MTKTIAKGKVLPHHVYVGFSLRVGCKLSQARSEKEEQEIDNQKKKRKRKMQTDTYAVRFCRLLSDMFYFYRKLVDSNATWKTQETGMAMATVIV